MPKADTETSLPAIPPTKVERRPSECVCHTHRGWVKSEGAGSAAHLRVGIVFTFLLLLYCGLGFRTAQIQITQSAEWRQKAENQRVARELQPAQRGPITDRAGLPLAYCVPRDTIIADLKLLKTLEERKTAAEKIAPHLKTTPKVLLDKMTQSDVLPADATVSDTQRYRRVVYLARNVDPDVAEKIQQFKIRGIGFEDEFRRTYPQGDLACHLLGWAGVDGGMEGVEMELNAVLSGMPGYLRYYRDAAKRLIALNDGAVGPADSHPPRDGLAVTLTIDARIQQTAEEELAKIESEFQPKAATCTIMDVRTGAILAMASTPPFDPNLPAQSKPEERRNRIITDFYEPGSTFKSFIAAMALEKKICRRNEVIDCENGAWQIGYRTLHDAHAHGLLTFDNVIAKSSNIGAAKIGQRFGVGGLYDAVTAFGFGRSTGINLPGETKGRVRPRKVWTNDSVYSVAMGHEIGCTPIQLVAAYAALVNGGVLYRPKIVQRVVNEQGEELYTLNPQAIRRVISEQTSAQMRDILGLVVKPGGTGTKAFCAEWSIGGKTGTTKKIDPVTKTYSSTLYIGSFCGFAPVENPRVVCLVTVDEPHKGSGYYGGTVACPAAREVIRKALSVLNVPPRSADEQKKAIAEARKVATN